MGGEKSTKDECEKSSFNGHRLPPLQLGFCKIWHPQKLCKSAAREGRSEVGLEFVQNLGDGDKYDKSILYANEQELYNLGPIF